jgi:hypothetical protein
MSTSGEVLDDTFGTLVGALERPLDDGGANGNGGNNGNNGGGGWGGGDESFDRLVKILREGLAQVGERQSDFTAELVEAAFARVLEMLTAQVKELAGALVEAAVQGDKAVVKELGEAVTRSISKNADVAEHLANFMDRVVSLEREVAALKAQRSVDERSAR